MTRGVIIFYWVIINVSISIPRLDALATHRHDGIRLRPASQRAVVPACVEEVQADASFFDLTRESPVGGEAGQGVSRLAPGFVSQLAQLVPVQRVGGQAGAA